MTNTRSLCPTISPTPKDSPFTIINDKEKHQVLSFKEQMFGIFAWKTAETTNIL